MSVHCKRWEILIWVGWAPEGPLISLIEVLYHYIGGGGGVYLSSLSQWSRPLFPVMQVLSPGSWSIVIISRISMKTIN